MPSGGTRSRNGSCRGGDRAMHRLDHALVLLRAGDGEHAGIAFGDLLRLGAHAAGDDHLAVLGERLADGGERFRLRAVEKAAGVDDHEVGALVLAGELVAFRAQPRDDALAESTSALGQPSETKLTFGACGSVARSDGGGVAGTCIVGSGGDIGEGLAQRGRHGKPFRAGQPARAGPSDLPKLAITRAFAHSGGRLEGWPSGLRQRS